MTKTFKQFIKEDKKVFDIEQFKKDCSYVLDLMKPINMMYLPWHGTRIGPANFDIVEWTERSKPRNTPQFVHDMANKWAIDKFGEPIRNWRFVTGDKYTAQQYGAIYAIFPIGKFEWVCSTDEELADLTVTYDMLLNEEPDKMAAANMLIDKMNNISWAHNTYFRASLITGFEIMFKCEKYYMLSIDGEAYEEVEQYLNK